MTLRRKTQLILGLILLVMLLLLDVTFTNILRDSAKRLDRERLEQDISRAVLSVRGEANTLATLAGVWANSNTTWRYMMGENPRFEYEGLNSDTMVDIGISSMIFLDNKKDIKLFKNYNADEEKSLPAYEFATIFMSDDTQNEDLLENVPANGIKGIAQSEGDPILFSITPIVNPGVEDSQAGYLIMTKLLDQKTVTDISRNIGINFSVEPVPQQERLSGLEPTHFQITDTATDSDSKMGSGSYIGKMLVKDHFGLPGFYVTTVAKKEDTSEAEKRLQYMFLLFAAAAIVICIFWDLIFKRIFSKRMSKLQSDLETIRDDPSVKGMVAVDAKKDEITKLGRTLNDTLAYLNFHHENKRKTDEISLKVYERYAESGRALYMKTLEDVAEAFSPIDERSGSTLARVAKKMEDFCRFIGMHDEDCYNCYLGALYSRIGLLGTDDEFRMRGEEGTLSPNDMRRYKSHPIKSKMLLDEIEVLRPISHLPFTWRENYDGTGYPQGLSGESIPLVGRMYAVVDAWNEMTKPWPGRDIPTAAVVRERLRNMAGKRLDPSLTEEFIRMMEEEAEAQAKKKN